jgi:hypothetical protein
VATLGEWARQGLAVTAKDLAEPLRKALQHEEVEVIERLLAMSADPNGAYDVNGTLRSFVSRSRTTSKTSIA